MEEPTIDGLMELVELYGDAQAFDAIRSYATRLMERKPLQGWMPIESAPDGVMLLFADMRATEARWWVFCGWRHSGTKRHMVQMPDNTARSATHWMPLPAATSGDSAQSDAGESDD